MRERAPRSFGLSKLWVSENLGNEEVEPIPTCEILFHRFSQQNMYLIKWFLLVQSVLRIYKGESIKNSFLLIFSICHSKKRPSNCKTNDCVKSTKIPDERVTQEAWILFEIYKRLIIWIRMCVRQKWCGNCNKSLLFELIALNMIEIAVVPDTFKPLDKGNISVPIQCILTICDLFLSLFYVIFITRIWNRYTVFLTISFISSFHHLPSSYAIIIIVTIFIIIIII